MASNDQAVRAVAQSVLYVVLDVALRLLSPFMPFLTEELFQRLPSRAPTDPPSISVAPYPQPQQVLPYSICNRVSVHLTLFISQCNWRNLDIEADVEFIQKIVKEVRSARANYNLPNSAKTEGENHE